MSFLSATDRALLVGLLLDGVEAVLRADEGAQAARRGRDAQAWMAARDPDWPFSFVSVCRMLAVDGEALRSALSSRRRGARLAPRPAAMRGPRSRPQVPIR